MATPTLTATPELRTATPARELHLTDTEATVLNLLASMSYENRQEVWKRRRVEERFVAGSFADKVAHALMLKHNRTEPSRDAVEYAIWLLGDIGRAQDIPAVQDCFQVTLAPSSPSRAKEGAAEGANSSALSNSGN